MALVVSGYLGIIGESFGVRVADESVRASAGEAVAFWAEGALAFDGLVRRLGEDELGEAVHVPHGGRAESRWKIADGIVRECVHHGAEIALLRDLYRHTRAAGLRIRAE